MRSTTTRLWPAVLCACTVLPIFLLSSANAAATTPSDVNDVQHRKPSDNRTLDQRILRSWEKFERNLQGIVDTISKKMLPIVIRRSSELDVSEECKGALLKVFFGIRSLKRWAFQFLDAAGKPAGGILTGTLTAFGSYDQCVAIKARDRPDEKVRFTGQYCTVKLRPPIPEKPSYYTLHDRVQLFINSSHNTVTEEIAEKMHFFYFLVYRYGVCVPSTCSRDDVQMIASSLTKSAEFEVNVSDCEVLKEKIEFTPDQTVIVVVAGSLLALVLLSTAVHIVKESLREKDGDETFFARFTTAFSLTRSLGRVFKEGTKLDHLSALHGLRVLSCLWFMFGHIFLFLNYQFFRNLMIAVGFAKNFPFQMVINSTLATDSLLFLNGFLFAYQSLAGQSFPSKKSSPFLIVLHRAYRASVSILLVSAVAIMLPIVGTGPMWRETMQPVADNCRANWWINLIFLNNILLLPEDRCLEISWYFSVLIQLCLVGSLVILVIKRRFFFGMALNVSLVGCCVIVMGVLTVTQHLPPTVLFAQADIKSRLEMENMMYQQPYVHMGPFCIGLGLACILVNKPIVHMNSVLRSLGWLCSALCSLAVLFGAYRWNCGADIATAPVALYAAAHRTAWALSVAWVTFSCVTKKAGIIGDFLSWPGFVPMSRLVPLVFLIHPLVQNTFTAYVRERVQADQLMAVFLFCGLIVLGFGGALICAILGDCPLQDLEALLCEKLGLSLPMERSTRKFLEATKPVLQPVLKALPLPDCTKLTILEEKPLQDRIVDIKGTECHL
ncbi:nose resistant to fluoxetine protein 6-like [Ornithodoros turicata]|uniref:nose resistant to fluoxetine protein 6-like n=1 Tax=Ornithodoros turicata TaxID=34597 RepID=UPI0031391016